MRSADPFPTPPSHAPSSTNPSPPAQNHLSPNPPATCQTFHTSHPTPPPLFATAHLPPTARSASVSIRADAQDNAADSCTFAILWRCSRPLDMSVKKAANKNAKKYLSTPVNVFRLSAELLHHPDPHFLDYVISGLSHGFHPGVRNLPTQSLICPNLQSALTEPETVDILIK